MSVTMPICNFQETSDNTISKRWSVVTDGVMGGLSVGAIAEDSAESESAMLFSGTVSLENSGGFASVRFTGALPNLAEQTGLRIRVNGDGKDYQLRAHLSSLEDGCAYKHDFATSDSGWQEIDLPFSEYVLSEHGKLDSEAGKLNSADITQLSFLIAGGQSGEFALRISSIVAYK